MLMCNVLFIGANQISYLAVSCNGNSCVSHDAKSLVGDITKCQTRLSATLLLPSGGTCCFQAQLGTNNQDAEFVDALVVRREEAVMLG